jgi:hypothetical protein
MAEAVDSDIVMTLGSQHLNLGIIIKNNGPRKL